MPDRLVYVVPGIALMLAAVHFVENLWADPLLVIPFVCGALLVVLGLRTKL